jgi:hypothetical protein
MEITDEAAHKAEELADDDDRLVIATDMKVQSDGRVSIDSATRERYGIEEGDYVDGVLVLGED